MQNHKHSNTSYKVKFNTSEIITGNYTLIILFFPFYQFSKKYFFTFIAAVDRHRYSQFEERADYPLNTYRSGNTFIMYTKNRSRL